MDTKIIDSTGVLLLQEAPLHPNSVLSGLRPRFEKPSIVNVTKRDVLRAYSKPPIFDEKYLVIFEDYKAFEGNAAYIRFGFMFPVVICSRRSALEDSIDLCKTKSIPYKVYVNAFEKEDAMSLIRDLASEEVSDNFCKVLINRVGLNPQRIISAVMVCEQVGYKTSNISRYIDKYTYIDVYDVLESLLQVCKSRAQIKRAALYVHTNRLWYKRYTRVTLVKEMDTLIQIYYDLIDGVLTPFTVQAYIEEKRIPKYRVMYAIDLYSQKSLVELLSLRQFLSTASILEVAMRLS